jgi:tryptophan-rich sensory protein
MITGLSGVITMHSLVSLVLFCLLVNAVVAAGGQFTGGTWYQAMNQPYWNPSAMVMTLVWAVLYVLMAVSAWLVWCTRRSLAARALGWWGSQLLLSVAWSWVYFGLHRPGWAMAVLGLWLLAVLVVIRVFRPIAITASNLMLPLAGWLLFSWLLNFVQWHLNGGGLETIL